MSVAKVLKLADYRDRRHDRLKLAQAFAQVDPGRRILARHLTEIAEISGADRAASVWIDEYGPGLVHPHAIVDLLADRPRRCFAVEPLQRAWEIGVPGAYDGDGAGGGSSFAIALGSDGARAWFVVADSVMGRPPLSESVRDRLMFLAGECSAVALHRDLDSQPDGAGFAGWQILEDLEGREDDDVESKRITIRFIAARVVRMLLDADGAMAGDRIEELVAAARREVAGVHLEDEGELGLWARVLTALEAGDERALATTLTMLGESAEQRGHDHGAGELYGCAYGVAASVHDAAAAADAARSLGRLHRRRARRDEAASWYETARDVARAARLDHLVARSLSGLATLRRERGNVPEARRILDEALQAAEASGDPATVVSIFRDLASLAHSAGDYHEAVRQGWRAVNASTETADRARSMASVAGALTQTGDLDSAADAWSVVAASSNELYLRAFAHDALGYISARRGDAEGFARHTAACDRLDHESLPSAHVQILRYRGLGHMELGHVEEAELWLRRAVAYAEEHGFSETLIRAEEDLAALPDHVVAHVDTTPAAPTEVREGLRSMRRELVGAS